MGQRFPDFDAARAALAEPAFRDAVNEFLSEALSRGLLGPNAHNPAVSPYLKDRLDGPGQ
jgi:hypothetical protein